MDIDSGNLKVYQNNTLVSTITLPTDKGDEWIPAFGDSSTTDASFIVNFGQDSSFSGNKFLVVILMMKIMVILNMQFHLDILH